jgi:hypothetical protein
VVNFSSRTFADSARMGPGEIATKRNVTHCGFCLRRLTFGLATPINGSTPAGAKASGLSSIAGLSHGRFERTAYVAVAGIAK